MRVPLPLVFWCVLSVFGLGACESSTKLSTQAPSAAVAEQPVPERRLSTINLPVTLPTAVVEKILNEQLTGVIYQDNDITDDDLAVKVTKTGPIRLKAEFSKLYVEVPLHVWAKGRWQWNACELCKNIQKSEETEFDMVVRTESRLQMLPNYQVKSYTTGDFSWGERKPTLSLGPLNINLAPFIEPKLKAQIAPMLKELDSQLQQRLNLQTYLAEAWRQLQQPISVHDTYQAWLTVEPRAVRMTPLELQKNQMRLNVGIDAFISVTTGKKPVLPLQAQLPAFTPVQTLPQEANIAVTTDLPYTYLTQMAQKEVKNQTFKFEEGKHQLTIHDIDISGTGSKLLLALDLSGSGKSGFITKKFQGKVYLQGTPYYDAASQSIKVKDLQYELKTRDQLLNTANWLLQNKFRTQLEDQMTVPIKDQLTSIKTGLQEGLKENRLQEHALLRGSVLSFAPDTLFLTPTGIRALFNATGKVALSLD
ncbi:DUF4403 family protein [Nibribacter ruber]|uniref:DUF4403 family protein n=1 Tax=Nibribacter ruber TaxID=2698458 RepID=A0A6P1P2A0_9BACT|nr:DUF4403 family protein [Nibribacter ruber]QHL88511.1 DUF4403 family protein [Nibribacter ruber]